MEFAARIPILILLLCSMLLNFPSGAEAEPLPKANDQQISSHAQAAAELPNGNIGELRRGKRCEDGSCDDGDGELLHRGGEGNYNPGSGVGGIGSAGVMGGKGSNICKCTCGSGVQDGDSKSNSWVKPLPCPQGYKRDWYGRCKKTSSYILN